MKVYDPYLKPCSTLFFFSYQRNTTEEPGRGRGGRSHTHTHTHTTEKQFCSYTHKHTQDHHYPTPPMQHAASQWKTDKQEQTDIL